MPAFPQIRTVFLSYSLLSLKEMLVIREDMSTEKDNIRSARVSRELTEEEKDLVDRSTKKIKGVAHGFSGDSLLGGHEDAYKRAVWNIMTKIFRGRFWVKKMYG